MKKFLALLLCALMAVSMMVPAMAADDDIYALDFEDVPLGSFKGTEDKITSANHKSGMIEVVEFGGSKVLRFYHKDTEKETDPYMNILENAKPNTVKDYGAGQQLVLEYDLYFESATEDMLWKFLLSQEYPPSTDKVAWCFAGIVKGDDLGVYAQEPDPEQKPAPEPAAHLTMGKWHKIAVALDTLNDEFSIYIDNKPVILNSPYVETADAAYSCKLRIGYQGYAAGDSVAYVDNIKVYNGTEPRGLEKAPETTAAPVTTAPVTTAAPTTVPAALSTPSAPATFDAGVLLAVAVSLSAAGVVIGKKRK